MSNYKEFPQHPLPGPCLCWYCKQVLLCSHLFPLQLTLRGCIVQASLSVQDEYRLTVICLPTLISPSSEITWNNVSSAYNTCQLALWSFLETLQQEKEKPRGMLTALQMILRQVDKYFTSVKSYSAVCRCLNFHVCHLWCVWNFSRSNYVQSIHEGTMGTNTSG